MSRFAVLLLALACSIVLAPPADASEGPPLRVPPDRLAAALGCSPGVADAGRDPVLLVPGTTLTPREFSWNYVPALRAQGVPYCTVTLPDNGMADIQVAAEYVVHAIRTVHAASGRAVDIVGHSQGGMVPRWALKYWPDTRSMVDDLVGLAPSNHGTIVANTICPPGCAPSFWQQRRNSAFLRALNSGPETWQGIDYTVVYTRLDEVVAPNWDERGSSSLRTGAGTISNIAVQDLCPLRPAEHLAVGTYDAVSYALAADALNHDGPADQARVGRDVCARQLMPYVDPVRFPANEARLATTAATQLALYPRVPAEPPLAPYAGADAR
ncbi:esterase/lipase family protein [Prauserella muralis]|uniref:Lipase n=1 Tax=Prauserella muralis TaxID=588067 RepID=A0A2V4BBS5_9PSEU|nr:alpha/beta fold hydrolase [Prauserella muralis]PXY32748.1 lipase [Prauserella muralis]